MHSAHDHFKHSLFEGTTVLRTKQHLCLRISKSNDSKDLRRKTVSWETGISSDDYAYMLYEIR